LESISDNALMNKVKDGDVEKLGLLFERYKKMLFSFFYHINHDAALSEDLVQSTFMRILKYRSGFKGSGDFKVWMFHIARNLSHDHYRKNKWKNGEDLDDWKERLDDGEKTQDLKIEDSESMKMLRAAIDRLDEDKKEVLTLSKLKGMKYKQIAEVLSCTEGAVKVKVFRALEALRKEYDFIMSVS